MEATRVLIVDDDPAVRRMLAEYLAEHGYAVAQAASGKEMRLELEREVPAAVLLDIGLPELSGHEVARKIRECCGEARPMLIGISGRYKRGADKSLAHLNGMNHYLVKPFDPSAILAFLAALKKPD